MLSRASERELLGWPEPEDAYPVGEVGLCGGLELVEPLRSSGVVEYSADGVVGEREGALAARTRAS